MGLLVEHKLKVFALEYDRDWSNIALRFNDGPAVYINPGEIRTLIEGLKDIERAVLRDRIRSVRQ